MKRQAIYLILAVLLAVAGGVGVWLQLERPVTGIDDADIFLVYARNLAEGNGFVYNVGGEHVEGFTSLLWTLICAVGFMGFQTLEKPLLLLNLLFGVLVIWQCLKRIERPGLFLLLLAAAPAWFAWCQLTRMETGLWCLLVTAAVLATVERRGGLLSGVLVLMALTRPESMLWGAWLLLVLWAGTEKGGRLRSVIGPVAAFGAALAGVTAFRLHYFGYPVPNTFFAKVSPNEFSNLWNGLGYLLGYLISNPAVPLVLALAALVLVHREKHPPATVRLVLCLLPGIVIPVLVGGDHFGAYRFYQPLWPLLCLAAVKVWPFDRFPGAAKSLPASLLLLGWVLFPFTANLSHEFRIAQGGRDTGEALTLMFCNLHHAPTVAAITAGGIKYSYDGMVYDVLGLNNTEMAHSPGPRKGYKNHAAFNADIFYEWHPDILLMGDSPEFDRMVLKGLQDQPRFKKLYREKTLTRNGATVTAYYSMAFLLRLNSPFGDG